MNYWAQVLISFSVCLRRVRCVKTLKIDGLFDIWIEYTIWSTTKNSSTTWWVPWELWKIKHFKYCALEWFTNRPCLHSWLLEILHPILWLRPSPVQHLGNISFTTLNIFPRNLMRQYRCSSTILSTIIRIIPLRVRAKPIRGFHLASVIYKFVHNKHSFHMF